MNAAASTRRPLYRHRQTGWPVLASACIPFVCMAAWVWVFPSMDRTLPPFLVDWSWAIPPEDRRFQVFALTAGFALVVLGFSWLTVVLTRTHLVIRFGIGLFRRTIPLARIRSARVARSRWIEGWGIHWTRRGMLYNVSGFDAVEVELDGGKTVRIGSDDAARLQRAIERAVADQGRTLPFPTPR